MRVSTAYHEAAHAVTYVVLKHRLRSVDIINAKWQLGRTVGEWCNPRRATKTRALHEAIYCVAGFVAEVVILARPTDKAIVAANDDLIEADRWCKRADVSPRTVGHLTGRLLRTHWSKIERIAAVLLDEYFLTAIEVKRLIEE